MLEKHGYNFLVWIKKKKKTNKKRYVYSGNPFTSLSIDSGGVVEFIYSHHLISITAYAGLRRNCNYTFPDVLTEKSLNTEKCQMFQAQATSELGNINPYDIYTDVCKSKRKYSRSNGMTLLKCLANSNLEMSTFARGVLKQKMLNSPYDPCQDNYLQSYLNDPAVQVRKLLLWFYRCHSNKY